LKCLRVRAPAGARRRAGDESGQALTETLLVTMPIIMVIAAALQIFLVDNAYFEVVTRGHQQLLTRALALNNPGSGYRQVRVSLNDPARNVPVVPVFSPFGLTVESLRIRSHVYPYWSKQLVIGAGTSASCVAVGLPPCR